MTIRSRLGVLVVAVAMLGLTGPATGVSPDAGPTAGGTSVVDGNPGLILTEVHGGFGHTVGLTPEGIAYAWGRNASGELGDGTTDASLVPVAVRMPEGVTFTRLVVGTSSNLALGSDGNVYAWGANATGALGDGTTELRSAPVRVQVPAGVTFTDVAIHNLHALALTSDGTVYAWGDNDDGQLGDGTTTQRLAPVPVQFADGVEIVSIGAGERYSMAFGADGVIYLWGDNSRGQLGLGSGVPDALVPGTMALPLGNQAAQVMAGARFGAALGTNGIVYTWGHGDNGQLGNDSSSGTTRYTPGQVAMPSGVRFAEIAPTSSWHVFARGDDGNVYGWGSNVNRQLGGTSSYWPRPEIVPIPAGVQFPYLVAGYGHSLAVGSDGEVYAWGWNFAGQLGDGTTTNRDFPALISAMTIDGVTFGGIPGDGLVQDEDGSWTVVSPTSPVCGPVDVEVSFTQYGRTRTVRQPDGFVYGTAARIISDPLSVDAEIEEPVTLTVDGTGDFAPTVQWQRSTTPDGPWEDVVDGTRSSLTVALDTTAHFRAVLSNCLGSQTSSVATVSVPEPEPVPEPTPVPTPVPTPEPTPSSVSTPGAGTAPTGPGRGDAVDRVVVRAGTGSLPLTGSAGLLALGGIALGLAAAGVLAHRYGRRRDV